MSDQYNLQRFVEAQASVFDTALSELENGRKRSHWMWFIFPQLQGLGHSNMARHYGISGVEEAVAYLHHPLLGARLKTCSRALLQWQHRSAMNIMGTPDDLKLKSSMTLFAIASPDDPVFQAVINAFYAGHQDSTTVSIMKRAQDDNHPAP